MLVELPLAEPVAKKNVVDNDGPHSAVESAGLMRLKAGLHPLVVTFFECTGQETLGVAWEGPGLKKQEIPSGAYFHRAKPAE